MTINRHAADVLQVVDGRDKPGHDRVWRVRGM